MGSSFRQTIAGIFSRSDMDVQTMLSGHLQATLSRAKQDGSDYLLALQDTCFFNYQGHKQMEGLGYLRQGIRGIIQHNVFLVNELGLPLGILDQQYWTRQGGLPFKGDKESQKWFNGLEAVNEHLGGPGAQKVVVVQDREADIFNFFQAKRVEGVEMLVRVCHDRNLAVVHSGQVCHLPDVAPFLSHYPSRTVQLQRSNQEIEITLAIQAGQVQVYPSKKLRTKLHKTQHLTLVVAQEIAARDTQGKDVYAPTQRALWYLLTSLPADSLEDIHRILDFYALRWRVERFHYTQKTGALQVEKLQFDDIHTTVNALCFYAIVAWQLLYITYALRQNAEQEAELIFEQKDVEILEKLHQKPIQSLRQATLALARIVGFASSKKQPLPGVKVLAKALERLYYIKMGNAL